MLTMSHIGHPQQAHDGDGTSHITYFRLVEQTDKDAERLQVRVVTFLYVGV